MPVVGARLPAADLPRARQRPAGPQVGGRVGGWVVRAAAGPEVGRRAAGLAVGSLRAQDWDEGWPAACELGTSVLFQPAHVALLEPGPHCRALRTVPCLQVKTGQDGHSASSNGERACGSASFGPNDMLPHCHHVPATVCCPRVVQRAGQEAVGQQICCISLTGGKVASWGQSLATRSA